MNLKKISGLLLFTTLAIDLVITFINGELIEPYKTIYKLLGFIAMIIILYDYFIKKK